MKRSRPKALKRPVLKVVDPAYQPSKAELEAEFDFGFLAGAEPDDVAKALLRPVDVRHVPKPPRGG